MAVVPFNIESICDKKDLITRYVHIFREFAIATDKYIIVKWVFEEPLEMPPSVTAISVKPSLFNQMVNREFWLSREHKTIMCKIHTSIQPIDFVILESEVYLKLMGFFKTFDDMPADGVTAKLTEQGFDIIKSIYKFFKGNDLVFESLGEKRPTRISFDGDKRFMLYYI